MSQNAEKDDFKQLLGADKRFSEVFLFNVGCP